MTVEDQSGGSWWSRRPTWQKVLLIVGGGLFVLMVFAAIFGDSETSGDAADVTSTSAVGETTTTGATEVTTTTETEATTTTVPETTTTTSTTTTAPTTTLPPVLAEGSGQGDDVVEVSIPETAVIVTFTHSGSSNFAVSSLDADFESIDLLVNTIGSYTGTRPMQFIGDEQVGGFEIAADGDWSYVIAPLEEARRAQCPTEGEGDDVVIIEDFLSSGSPADLTFDADTNFAIWAWSTDGRDLIVNDIGPYEGTVVVPSGMAVWDITGDGGSWTVDCG